MDKPTGDVQQAPQGQAEQNIEQGPNVQGQSPSQTSPNDPQAPRASTGDFEELSRKKGFRSPDDLAKSYRELESQNKKVEMSNAELQKMFFDNQQTLQPSLKPASKPSDEDLDKQALQELDSYVDQKLSKKEEELRKQFQIELERRDLHSAIKEHPDFKNYAEDIKDLKKRYPSMPFEEAYNYAKAVKGDTAKESKAEGMSQAIQAIQQQNQAQVSPEKQTPEQEIPPQDILKGAGRRWTPKTLGGNSSQVDPRAVREIEQLEKQLFGHVLEKTSSGL